MVIKADEEGLKTLTKLCDVVLRAGGIENLNAINAVISSIGKIEEKEEVVKTEEKE